MQNKIAVMLLVTAVLLTSVATTVLPANALTRNSFNDSHTTARYGNSVVCGDHICKPGEHEKMSEQLNNAQRSAQAGQMTTTTPSAPSTPSMSDVCTLVKNALDKAQVDSAVTTMVMSKIGC